MNRLVTFAAAVLLAIPFTQQRESRADDPLSIKAEAEAAARRLADLNVPTKTNSLKLFWADEHYFHDWHIQRNVFTGHYRLLDGGERRLAWGSFDHCRAELDKIKKEQRLPPMTGKAVVLLHGLASTPFSMRSMASYLQKANYKTFNVCYPSSRGGIDEHSTTLARVIGSLEGIEEINFVAHSLGNIVVRRYLAMQTDPAKDRRPDPRIKRIVMLTPPNHGAHLAAKLVPADLLGVAGDAAEQVGPGWKEFEKKLITPQVEFGILAGGRGDGKGYNILLPGDNDSVITVATTRLAGARDFRVLPVIHLIYMNDAKVQEYTLRFLQHGHFESEKKRQAP